MTPERYQEIKRLLELKLSLRAIERTKGCTRRTIRGIRDGQILDPSIPKKIPGPIWVSQVDWDEVTKELKKGHPLSFIWDEVAKDKVGYIGFWKQFHKKFPQYKQASVVHRVFEPGDRCEVDYAGQKAEWIDIKTGIIHEVPVFIGALGCSQLFFATAKPNAKSPNFLECHNEMYKYFGGVPKITVPDCLKTGVIKCNIYDPDLNASYEDMSKHYETAIVPARPRRPKDKAIVEGAVKLVMRYFNWRFRKTTFTSLKEVNEALKVAVNIINQKPHSRFKVSRYQRWNDLELPALGKLPSQPYEYSQWKICKLHPDSHLSVENNFYSAPHIYRGLSLKVKITVNKIEIFKELNRVALHKKYNGNNGKRITELSHLPDNAKAYHEATPQNLLSQSKFLSIDLYNFVDELFKESSIAHLRRVQGLIAASRKEINVTGHELAKECIKKSIESMKRFNKNRVPYFKDQLKNNRNIIPTQYNSIKRKGGNPMLRHTTPSKLKLITNPPKGERENVSTN